MSSEARRIAGVASTVIFAVIVVIGFTLAPTTEADRVVAIGNRIMCPVCQGESISTSPSETARAMLDVVAEKVAAGETDEAIIAYFVASYGEAILLDPPFAGKTLAVWLLPLPIIALGAWMAVSRLHRSRPIAIPQHEHVELATGGER